MGGPNTTPTPAAGVRGRGGERELKTNKQKKTEAKAAHVFWEVMKALDAVPLRDPRGPRDGWPRAGWGAVSQPQWQMPRLKEANVVYLEAT